MRHPEEDGTMGAGAHLDEGAIHAWLDDALPADEAAAAERHVAACAACAAAVAEARGLIAASSRILGALDAVPGGVLPAAPRAADPDVRPLAAPMRATRPWRRWPVQAAAAAALVAVGTWAVVEGGGPAERSVALDDRPLRTAASVEAAPEVMRATGADTADAAASGFAAASSAVEADAPTAAVAPAAPGAAARTVPPVDASVPAVVERPADAVAFVGGARAPAPAPARPLPEADAAARARVQLRGADVARRAPAAAPPAAPAPTPPPPAAMAAGADVPGAAVSGVVLAESGKPVARATVAVPGTALAAQTDSAGRFTLAVPPGGADSAVVLGIGFRPAVVRLAGADDRRVRVVLEPEVLSLSEVVVTGVAKGGATSATGCYRAEVAAAAPAALRRALAGPLRLTDEAAGGAWRRVRTGERPGEGAAVARWREEADGAVEVEWTAAGGPRLRLRAADGALVGEGQAGGAGAPVPVTLRPTDCAG